MTNGRAWRAGLAGLTGVGIVLAAGAASSAPAPAPSASGLPSGSLSREQINPAEQLPQGRHRRPPDVFAGPVTEICPLSDAPNLAFEFKEGVIQDDAKVLSEGDRRAAWGGLVGRKITPRQLCEIRDRLAQRIFQRGILARVVIPPQTISSGVVKFQIIAAKIVAVRFDGDIGPGQAQVEAYLDHLRMQNTFSLDAVQKWLLLVNDIPGVLAVAKIVHSTTPGAPPEGLDLVVTVRRTAVDESAMIANTNAQTLGPWTALARVDFNSFTPLGERTSLVAYSTLGNYRQEVIQVQESARLGDSGLFAQASFAYGHARPGNVLEPLDLTGVSYSGTFELDYPVIRLQRESLIVAAGMDIVDQNTTLPTHEAISDDALRVAWVRVDGAMAATDRRWGDTLVSTAADLSISGRKGLEILGASEAGAPDLSRTGGFADAWVLRGDGHASIRIAPLEGGWPPVTLTSHFLGQWADRPLLAYEQQAIGNLTVGRGYDPSAVSGDNAIAGEIKAAIGPFRAGRVLSFSPYIFGDDAQVSYQGTGLQSVTLRSLGGGMELRFPYDRRGDAVRMDLGYAKPLDRLNAIATKKPPERFYVQLIVNH